MELGSLAALARHAIDYQRDPLRFFEALRARHGDSVVFPVPRIGRRHARPLLVTSDPALVRQVLTDERLRNSALALAGPRGSAQRRLRQSLFRMHGEAHRRHRRLLGEALGRRAVEAMAPAMLRAIDHRLADWQPGERVDLPGAMKHLARDVAASLLFGLDDLGEAAALGAAIEDWWADSFRLGPRLLRTPRFGPTRRMLAKADALERRVRALVAERRAAPRSGDLFSAMVGARDERGQLSEHELIGHVHMMFLAAHETTAYALTWALVLLAQHPASARAVAAEVASAFAASAPDASVLEHCPRLHDVIRESQRLLPVVPVGARIAAVESRLGPLTLPRGARVLIPFVHLHHDPEVFEQPRRFQPERWRGAAPPPYHYLPFSAGPHMCIGVNFATQTLALTLARILQRFRLRLAPGTRIDRRVTVTLAPRGPIPVDLESADPGPGGWQYTPLGGTLTELVDFGGGADRNPGSGAPPASAG